MTLASSLVYQYFPQICSEAVSFHGVLTDNPLKIVSGGKLFEVMQLENSSWLQDLSDLLMC
jgi:hypothetical protein